MTSTNVEPGAKNGAFAPRDVQLPLRPAVRSGNWIAVSGQVGHIEFRIVDGGVQAELRQALTNLRELLAEHGSSMNDVVKTNVILRDIADFDVMNRVYLEFFDLEALPARTSWSATLPFGALVEVEAWAYVGEKA